MVEHAREVSKESLDSSAGSAGSFHDLMDYRVLLAKPHYELVSLLQQRDISESIGPILDLIYSESPTRAALVFSDLHGLTQDPEYMRGVLDRCGHRDELIEAIKHLPTYDAIACRRDTLGQEPLDALRVSVGAMYTVMRNEPVGSREYQSENLSPHLDELLTSKRAPFPARLRQALAYCQEQAESYCAPLTHAPQLNSRHTQLLAEFYDTVAAQHFPVDRYGYGCVHEILETANQAGDVWTLKNPNSNLDLPEMGAHQCVDSASAARSFFVSRGIPADVYHMSLRGMQHNVAVVFFPQESPASGGTEAIGACGVRYVPVVVDASPFGGTYPVEYIKRGYLSSFSRALGIESVHNHRTNELPFVEGDGLSGGVGLGGYTGLLPWCVREAPCQLDDRHEAGVRGDLLVAFAGVSAMQEQHPRIERGDPRYHGRGIRTPRIAFAVTVITANDCEPRALENLAYHTIEVEARDVALSETVLCKWRTYAEIPEMKIGLVLTTQGQEIPNQIQQQVVAVVREELPKVKAFLERIGYPMKPRVFRSGSSPAH